MAPAVEVVVQDPGWCVGEQALRIALADLPLRGARIEVHVVAERDLRRIGLRVVRRETVWERAFGPISVGECGAMPALLAASVRAHFIETDPPWRVDTLLPVTASFGVTGWDPDSDELALGLWRVGLGPRVELRLPEADLVAGVRVEGGPPFPIGDREAWLGEVVAVTGVGLVGLGTWRMSAGVGGGAAMAQGLGFVEDHLDAGPVAFGWLDLGNRVAPGLDASLGLRVHAVRPRVVVQRPGDDVLSGVAEPWVRAELTVAPVVKSVKVRRAAGHEGGR